MHLLNCGFSVCRGNPRNPIELQHIRFSERLPRNFYLFLFFYKPLINSNLQASTNKTSRHAKALRPCRLILPFPAKNDYSYPHIGASTPAHSLLERNGLLITLRLARHVMKIALASPSFGWPTTSRALQCCRPGKEDRFRSSPGHIPTRERSRTRVVNEGHRRQSIRRHRNSTRQRVVRGQTRSEMMGRIQGHGVKTNFTNQSRCVVNVMFCRGHSISSSKGSAHVLARPMSHKDLGVWRSDEIGSKKGTSSKQHGYHQ